MLLTLAWSNQISADTLLGTHTSGSCTVQIYSDINNKQYITVTKSSGTGAMTDAQSYGWSGAKTSIRFINIADEVTYISTNSFEGFSNLIYLSIGTDVTNIGTSAFKDCTSLSFVVFKGTSNPSGTDAFTNVGTLSNPVELYVPNISSNNVVSTLGLSTTSTTGVYRWKGGYFKIGNSLPVVSWTGLLYAMAAGGNIKLAGDCTDPSPSSSSYLEVPSGKTVTLDLNGYTINHNLTTSVNLGWVIKVNGGTLTINDSSTGKTGKITGGHFGPINMAGGIYNLNGTVTINGGSIINNTGNGICNKEASSRLTINGGTISGNTNYGIYNEGTLYLYGGTFSDNNGALYTKDHIHIKGRIDITGNSDGTNYLKLPKFKKMIVDGALSSSTIICVDPEFDSNNPYPRVITSGLNGNGSIDNFTSLSSDYAVRQDNYREAALKVVYSPTLNMANWTYGGNPSNPSLSTNPGNGFVTYTYKADGATLFTDTKPIIAGTHTVKAVVRETAGYTSAEVTTNYTVAQREATISWTNTALTYNGTAQKPTASLSNLVTGDACTVTVSGEQTNASNSPYTAIATALDNANYKLPTEDANKQTTFTIGKATLSVSGSATATAVYGTQVNAISISGLTAMLGETAVGGSWAFASTDIPIVNGTTSYTATFTPTSGASNYNELTQQIIPTITAKALTITADNKNITYGDAAPAYTVSYDGFIDGESAVNLTGTASYDCAYQQYDNVGNYTITPSGPYADNYAINFMQGTLTVAEKGVVVTGITASDKVYDGTTAATINSTATFTGKFENDELTLTATGAFDNANVGNNKAVTVSSHALGGASAGNYTITSAGNETTANITPKTVGITWGPTILTYNNTPQAPTATATELVDGDACNVTVTGQQTAVGVYSGANVATASALDNPNYQLPTSGLTTSFEIANPLSMSFAANQLWGTWYGDHNYDVPAGMTAYKVSSVSGTTVTVDAIGYVPANTGVLINRTSTEAADVNSNIYNGDTDNITSLLRSGNPTAYTDYILNNDQFVLSSVSTIGEHRCYLPASGTAGTRGLTIVVGDNTTDIEQKVIDIIETGEWYDMQGRRIERPHKKGLYIRDGKKVVIK